MAHIAFPYTSTSYSSTTAPELIPHTSTVTFTTNSTTVETITQQTTTTSQVWNIGQTTLYCDFDNQSVEWTSQSSALSVGMDVKVSWNASNTIDIYVFNSTQYSNWVSSGTTSPNVAEQSNAPISGSLRFNVSDSGMYWLVLHNPHLGLFCAGSSNPIVHSATGEETHQVPVVSTVTQTQTYTTSSQTISTQTATTTIVSSTVISGTGTTTTTKSCSFAFWGWLFGSKACP